MKLSRYLKDKLYFIILFITFLSLIILFFVGFKVSLVFEKFVDWFWIFIPFLILLLFFIILAIVKRNKK